MSNITTMSAISTSEDIAPQSTNNRLATVSNAVEATGTTSALPDNKCITVDEMNAMIPSQDLLFLSGQSIQDIGNFVTNNSIVVIINNKSNRLLNLMTSNVGALGSVIIPAGKVMMFPSGTSLPIEIYINTYLPVEGQATAIRGTWKGMAAQSDSSGRYREYNFGDSAYAVNFKLEFNSNAGTAYGAFFVVNVDSAV